MTAAARPGGRRRPSSQSKQPNQTEPPRQPGQSGQSGRPGLAALLTPGAGATRDHSALVAIDRALTEMGVPTDRIDLRSSSETRLLAAVTDGAEAVATRAGVGADRVLLGGRSRGGRMCSMAVAAGLPAAGLVLISYPLHPPGKPEKLRIDHLPNITVPVLAISGERDAFGTPDELRLHLAAIKGPLTLELLKGDHGLRGRDDDCVRLVTEWVQATFGP